MYILEYLYLCVYIVVFMLQQAVSPLLYSRSQISRFIAVNYAETNQAVKIVSSLTFYTEYRETKP